MLLTIAIPTYNRASYLDLNLRQLFSQLKEEYAEELEIFISNNESKDNTDEVVKKYLDATNFKNVIYKNHEKSIGGNENLAYCFAEAKGDFVVVFGDDDFLVDGALAKIMQVVRTYRDAGVIHVNHYGYYNDYTAERPKEVEEGFYLYEDAEAFINRVTYNFTFITGNIINKKLATPGLELHKFIKTGLNQLNWTYNALSRAPHNIFIAEPLIAMKTANTGGYGFCEVFGRSNREITNFFLDKGFKKSYFTYYDNKLLTDFFPHLIKITKPTGDNYKKENYFKSLYPVFKNKPQFWLFCFPVIVLPDFLKNKYTILNRIYHKLDYLYHIRYNEMRLKKAGKIKTLTFDAA